jgi:hypothetical protein
MQPVEETVAGGITRKDLLLAMKYLGPRSPRPVEAVLLSRFDLERLTSPEVRKELDVW